MAICEAKTAKGKPCKRPVVGDLTVCVAHAGLNGRKHDFTPEIGDKILQMLRAGNYVDVACEAAGVGRRTFYNWIARPEPVFREFADSVEQARAEGEVRSVALIAKAASRSWQAAAWLLERQYPERWGRPHMRQEKNGDETAVSAPADPFAEADELAKRRAARDTR